MNSNKFPVLEQRVWSRGLGGGGGGRSTVQSRSKLNDLSSNYSSTCFYNSRRLTSEFSIHFGEIHNIRIVQWPESIKLQVNHFSVIFLSFNVN